MKNKCATAFYPDRESFETATDREKAEAQRLAQFLWAGLKLYGKMIHPDGYHPLEAFVVNAAEGQTIVENVLRELRK